MDRGGGGAADAIRRPRSRSLAAPLLAGLLLLAPLLLTSCGLFKPRAAIPADRPLRVVTWNVGYFRGADGFIDFDRAVAVLRDWSPDIILFQDIDRRTVRALARDQPAMIADDLVRLLSGERPLHCANPEVLP